MQHILNGINVHYETNGSHTGLPVVFIHGFPFSSDMWAPQVDALKEFHLVTYDVRGHGQTGVGDGQYTVEYFVDDLIALLDHLALRKVVVVGLSMGGYIALRAIERHPDRFRGLVLCDTKSDADNNDGKIRRALQAKMVKEQGVKEFSRGFLTDVFAPETFRRLPATIERTRKIVERTKAEAIAGTLIGLAARTDSTPLLSTLKIPTLILVGEQDKIAPPSVARSMREEIRGAEMHIIPNAGHMANLENPDEFNDHLRKFLRKI